MLTRLGVLLLPLILSSGLARSEEPAPADGPLLSFRIRILNVPAETYEKVREGFALDEKKPVLLGEKQLATFLETVQGDNGANILLAPQIATLPNQSASSCVGEEKLLVTGTHITLVNGSPLIQPQVSKTFTGLKMNMTPRLAGEAAGNAVELDLKIVSTRLGRMDYVPVTTLDFKQLLQKPEILTNTLDRKLHLSFGKSVVLPGWWEEAKPGEKPSRVVVCVTAEGK